MKLTAIAPARRSVFFVFIALAFFWRAGPPLVHFAPFTTPLWMGSLESSSLVWESQESLSDENPADSTKAVGGKKAELKAATNSSCGAPVAPACSPWRRWSPSQTRKEARCQEVRPRQRKARSRANRWAPLQMFRRPAALA